MQQSASGSYTQTAAARDDPSGNGLPPPPLAPPSAAELEALHFGVSPHTRCRDTSETLPVAALSSLPLSPPANRTHTAVLTRRRRVRRYVHVFASSTSDVSMAAFPPHELALDGDSCATTRREVLRRAASAFLRSWEAQPAHCRPFAELPCTLASLPQQCEGLRQVINEGRAHSRQRHAPRSAPSEREQASLPASAVWIPAAVRECRTGTFEVRVHWQPFDPSCGSLLCANSACFRPLGGARLAERGRTPHPLPDPLPERARLEWHTEHESSLGLVCGGVCLKAHQLVRDPASVRRTVRRRRCSDPHILANRIASPQSPGIFRTA